ncbi:MAG: hypothetical protein ACYC3I_20295 [Gemmataceae bacterium]
MLKSDLIHLFHTRWQEIARHFWPEAPRQQVESELARFDAELERRQRHLLFLRKRIEKLHNSLKQREHRLELSAAQMHEALVDAGAVAELERRRRNVDRLRERVREREHDYALMLARLRQRKQKRVELRERLHSGSLPKQVEDESDPDYLF